ncbi:DNA/RNA non-specific endonuclease [Actinomycetes bacterium M1A6_2h]
MGYEPTFLALTDGVDIPAGEGLVDLSYTHFTVSMNTDRRLAAVTGVNVDGSQLREIEREDDWQLDPRLPEDQQAGEQLYADNDIDRGHLVRRRDPVWGEVSVAEQANVDTFHYTVCAPQTSVFNQSMDLWLGLEDFVLAYAGEYGQKISVFTGCVFAADDPLYRDIAVPRRFFKIAAWAEGDALATSGYVLDQSPSLDDIPKEVVPGDVPPLGPYRTFQVPVVDIANLTGLAMDSLSAADRYLVPATATAEPERWRELTSYADITMRTSPAGEPAPLDGRTG